MNKDKVMILKMLEEGKLSADEAAKLLAAMKEDKASGADSDTYAQTDSVNSNSSQSTTQGGTSNETKNNKSTKANSNKKLDEFEKAVERFSKGFAKKAEVIAKEMSPKIQNFTETFVEKTVEVTDRITKAMSTPSPAPTHSRPTTSSASASTGYSEKKQENKASSFITEREKSCELIIESGITNELNIMPKNGRIYIKAYNGDKITAKIFYRATEDNIQFAKSGNRYYLDYDDSSFESVSLEAFVPEKLFKKVFISAVNSKIEIDGIEANEIVVETSAAEIVLRNMKAEYIKAETDKANIILDSLIAENVKIITSNGRIDTNENDIKSLKLDTDNAIINFGVTVISKFDNYLWEISTSNAPINVNVPVMSNIGYKVNAKAAFGKISIGLSGLDFSSNESSYVEAQSTNYELTDKKINMKIETSNAALNIN